MSHKDDIVSSLFQDEPENWYQSAIVNDLDVVDPVSVSLKHDMEANRFTVSTESPLSNCLNGRPDKWSQSNANNAREAEQ